MSHGWNGGVETPANNGRLHVLTLAVPDAGQMLDVHPVPASIARISVLSSLRFSSGVAAQQV
jgi:hypothetical protein